MKICVFEADNQIFIPEPSRPDRVSSGAISTFKVLVLCCGRCRTPPFILIVSQRRWRIRYSAMTEDDLVVVERHIIPTEQCHLGFLLPTYCKCIYETFSSICMYWYSTSI